MKKTVTLPVTEYEVYYFPLALFFQKRDTNKKSFKTILRQELEKVHPAFDNTSYFSRLVIKDKRIHVMVIVIQNTILSQYDKGKGKKIIAQGKTIYPVYKTYYAVFCVLLICLTGIGLLLWRSGNNHASSINVVDYVPTHSAAFIQEEARPLLLSDVMYALHTFSSDKKVSYESLSFTVTDTASVLMVNIHNAFPEELNTYFENSRRKYTAYGKVTYQNNIPSYAASFTVDTSSVTSPPDETLVQLRTMILQNGGILLYEDSILYEIKASIPSRQFHSFIREISKEGIAFPIVQLTLSKEKNGDVGISVKTALQGAAFFSHTDVKEYLEDYFLGVEDVKKNQQTKPVVQKENTLKGEVVGKVLQEDGTVKVFYKTKEGKLVSEVEQ